MIETNKMFWVDKIEDCINLSVNKEINIFLEKQTLFSLDTSNNKINAVKRIKEFCKRVDVSTKELSIGLLEFNLNEKISHFSYPEGQEDHYNQRVIDKLKASQIVCSPSAIHGLNNHDNDLFNLYRIMPGFMGIPFPYD